MLSSSGSSSQYTRLTPSAGMFLAFARASMLYLPVRDYADGSLAGWMGSGLWNLSLAIGSEVTASVLAYRIAHTVGRILLLLFITGEFALTGTVRGRGSTESGVMGWYRHGPVLVGALVALYAFSVIHSGQVETGLEREMRVLSQYGQGYILQQMGWGAKR